MTLKIIDIIVCENEELIVPLQQYKKGYLSHTCENKW